VREEQPNCLGCVESRTPERCPASLRG